MHRFLQVLRKFKKLQRCYTQNLDKLKTKTNLNANIEFKDCDVIQLHNNFDFFKCFYCKYLTN